MNAPALVRRDHAEDIVSSSDHGFTVLVPCFNEEGAVRETVESLVRALDGHEYYLLFIDDGSQDGSGRLLDDLEQEHSRLRVVHHRRNQGYGAALKTGVRRARTELIVITDADGTYPIDRILELVALCRDADMVVGARVGHDVEYSTLRKVPKFFLRAWVQWLAGAPVPDMNSGLRVFRRSVAERFLKLLPDGFSFTTTITLSMLCNRFDVRFVPIGYKSRVGSSKIQPIRDTLRFTQLILRTGMYFAPLRVLLPVVFLQACAAGASLYYDIFIEHNLTDKTVILLMFTLTTGMFALLADMIDKRSAM